MTVVACRRITCGWETESLSTNAPTTLAEARIFKPWRTVKGDLANGLDSLYFVFFVSASCNS